MGILKRILGICETRPPADAGCWSYADGKVEIDLDRAPELAAKGGAIRLEGGSLPMRVLVLHGEDGAFHAFPNRCTHMGHRRLDPLPGEQKIRCCSIGRSTFDYSGRKISGLAPEGLQPLGVELVEGEEGKKGKLLVSLS